MQGNNDKPHRRIGLVTAISIVVANMIGAGIFTTSGLAAGNLSGPLIVLFFWIFGGMVALSGALCYVELATRMPQDGGEYLYLKRLYDPAVGFLSGWTSFFIGFSAPIAASAIGFSEYIFQGDPTGRFSSDPVQIAWVKKIMAITVIVLFTILHYFGHKWGSRVQNLLTGIKIAIVLGLAVAGLSLGKGDWSNFSAHANDSHGAIAAGTAMMLIMFSYSGWNASSYIAGEIRDPGRTLPRSLILGTVIVILIYLSINLFIFYAIPFHQAQGVITIVESASAQAFGEWFGRILGILSGIALLSSLSAFILLGPRIYYAMGRDKLFFPFAARIHPRFGVPGISIIIQGAISIILVLIGSFEQIVIFLEFALLIFPLLAVFGLFIARKRKIGNDTAVPVKAYPYIPVFFLLSSIGIMVIAFLNRPLESVSAIVAVSAGVPIYFLWKKKWK